MHYIKHKVHQNGGMIFHNLICHLIVLQILVTKKLEFKCGLYHIQVFIDLQYWVHVVQILENNLVVVKVHINRQYLN
jgi:hypothetical protein